MFLEEFNNTSSPPLNFKKLLGLFLSFFKKGSLLGCSIKKKT